MSNLDRPAAIREVLTLMLRMAEARATRHPLLRTDLTVPQMKVLLTIGRGEKMRPGEIAQRIAISPSNLTGILDRLGYHGYTQREVDMSDRRALVVSLTPAGRKLVRDLLNDGRDLVAATMEDVSDEELDALLVGLRAVVRSMQQRALRAGEHEDDESAGGAGGAAGDQDAASAGTSGDREAVGASTDGD